MYIFILTIDRLSWDAVDTILLSFVSSEQKQKILSYRNPADMKRSLYAILLVKMIINKMTDVPVSEISFSYGIYGKPYLTSFPNFHFNLSHTKNRILCCINTTHSIGVDIEYLRDAPLNIMNLSFHDCEKKYVDSATITTCRNLRFFKIWTQKEAYTKYLGTGLTLSTTEFNTLDPQYSNHFLSWSDNIFVYSIYSDSVSIDHFEELYSLEMCNYYLKQH